MNTPTRRLLGLAAVVAVVAASCSALTREPELDPPPSLSVQTGPGARFVGTAAGFSDWYGPGSMRHVGATEAGRAALEITAEPGGLQANARKALVPLRDGSPFSWSFSVRTADWSQVANIQFRLHTTDDDFFYANVRDRTARTALVDDAWQRVQLSRADFLTVGEPDWRRLEAVSFAVWGFTDGEDGPTSPTVLVDEVQTHPRLDRSAPGAGVVTLSFDDGDESVADAARLMREHYFRGTAFVVPDLVDEPGFLDGGDLESLDDLGWDLGGHSDIPLTELTTEALEDNVEATARWLRERGSRGSHLYAYPNGAVDPEVRRVVADYFSVGRTINENVQPVGDIDPYAVKSLNVYSDQSLEDVIRIVDASVDARDWLVLTFHRVGDETGDGLDWTTEKFSGLLDHLAARGIEVQPMSEVLAPM